MNYTVWKGTLLIALGILLDTLLSSRTYMLWGAFTTIAFVGATWWNISTKGKER